MLDVSRPKDKYESDEYKEIRKEAHSWFFCSCRDFETICDYAGAPPLPKATVARSWRPLLEGQDVDWRGYLIGETSVGPVTVAVRTDRFKSIINAESTRFYDLQDDPLETRDLSDEPAYAGLVKQHRDYFRDYLNQIEVFPEPKEGQSEGKRGNLYREYIEWYESVKGEA